MKKMRKITLAILALGCALGSALAFVGCGGGDDGGSTPEGPDNAAVTADEWQTAVSGLEVSNATTTQWNFPDGVEATDANKSLYKSKKINYVSDGGMSFYTDEEFTNPNETIKKKYSFTKEGGVTSLVRYEFNTEISKWKPYEIAEASGHLANMKNKFIGFNTLKSQSNVFFRYTYDKTTGIYSWSGQDNTYELKFADKQLVSFTYRGSSSIIEINAFGSTNIVMPAPEEIEMTSPLGKTFRLAEVLAVDSSGNPITDNAEATQMVESLKPQINNTAICPVENGGQVRGTCNFGIGALNDLQGEAIFTMQFNGGGVTVEDGYGGTSQTRLTGMFINEKLVFDWEMSDYSIRLVFII